MTASERQRLFLRYLRMGLWSSEETYSGQVLSLEDWKQLFRLAHSQGVTGLFIDGVARDSMRPENGLWDQWIAHLFYLEQANRYLVQRGEAWIKRLGDVDISASVFKGSSVGDWYPDPLHRSHGDIDIVISDGWGRLEPMLVQEERGPYRSDENEIILEEKNGLLVEFHRRWECLYNPWTNRRLQQWCRNAKTVDNELYLVCLILHIQRHSLTYGIGLKQVCDVAVMWHRASLDRERVASLLRSLHAERFSRLLFGFIAIHLGSVEDFPLPPVTEGKGFELLNDVILHEGYNLKMEQELVAGSKSWAMARIVSNAAFWTKRSCRVFRIMPGEACCFLLYKAMERMKKLIKIKHT